MPRFQTTFLRASLAACALLLATACGGAPDEKAGAPQAAAAPAPAKPAATPATAPATRPAAPAPAAAAAPATPADEAKAIFVSRCSTCHGMKGMGDGPGSLGLDPKPRNFSDPEWQASVTDEHIEKIIVYGGIAVGKSAAMPPNPDLMSKPQVVAELRAMVRALAKEKK